MYYTWYGILKLIAGIIAGLTAFYVWRRRTTTDTFWFAVLMGCIAFWALTDSFEAMTVLMDQKIFLSKVSYAGVTSIAPLWLI